MLKATRAGRARQDRELIGIYPTQEERSGRLTEERLEDPVRLPDVSEPGSRDPAASRSDGYRSWPAPIGQGKNQDRPCEPRGGVQRLRRTRKLWRPTPPACRNLRSGARRRRRIARAPPTIRPCKRRMGGDETRKTFRMGSLLSLALQSNTKGEA